MSRRNDAVKIYDVPTYKQIFPFIMPKRCDSLVYQSMVFDFTNTIKFIKEHKAPDGRSYRVFEVFIAALMRTIALRPELNRFIANHQSWQRNELSVNFVVKEDYTDDAPEHSMPLFFSPEMTLDEMATIINQAIIEERTPANENFTDKAILFFLHFPHWFIKLVVLSARTLDKHGKAPKSLRDADGLHTTIFISNMGSIGLGGGSPHHHLYEWGTTSLFATMGLLRRTRHRIDDKIVYTDSMEVGFTVDERITDGFYFTKSLKLFQELLDHPELLIQKPTLPPVPLAKKKTKKRRKALRKIS